MMTNTIEKLNETIEAAKLELAITQHTLDTLEETRSRLLGEDEEHHTNGKAKTNGHATNGNGKPKLKLKLKVGKADGPAIVKAIKKAEDGRLSTGKVAAQFFGGDGERAETFLSKLSDVEYHKRGRGGYWTLAGESDDA